MTLKIIIAIFSLIYCVGGHAFDDMGLSSGEPKQVVLDKLLKQGYRLTEHEGNYMFHDTAKNIGNISFCEGALHFLSYQLDGGFKSFIQKVLETDSRFGSGDYFGQAIDTNIGPFNEFGILWELKDETVAVTYTGSNSKLDESVRVTWRLKKKCQ